MDDYIKNLERNNKRKSKSINLKKIGFTLLILSILLFVLIITNLLLSTPQPPKALLNAYNEKEVKSVLKTVQTIEEETTLNNEVKVEVSNLLRDILVYDKGQVVINNGSIEYRKPDKPLMGILQRLLMAASEEKIKVISLNKTPNETLEGKLITSSNNPIKTIFRPAIKGNINKAVLNVYMNNGDPPVSLAISLPMLKAFAFLDYASYFASYVGSEENEDVWLDDDYLQRFVADIVPVFYSMMSYSYKASNRNVPESIQEDITLKLCESWNGITPMTRIDKCNANIRGQSNEVMREGS